MFTALEKKMIDNCIRIDLDLTGLCNRTCRFCPRYDDLIYPNVNKHMSMEVIDEVIRQMELVGFDDFVELAGRGEPTLHPEFHEVLDKLNKPGRTWKLRVTTNCHKLEEHWDHMSEVLDDIILNTYTTREEHEERLKKYPRLKNGKLCQQYFKPDGLTPEEMNKSESFILVSDMDKPADKRPTFHWTFNNRAGTFNENFKEGGCWHPMRQIFINYEGKYQMCCNDWTYQIEIGDILERDLFEMYCHDPKLNRIRWQLVNGRRSAIKPCSMCDDQQGLGKKMQGTYDRFRQADTYRQIVCPASIKGKQYDEQLRNEGR